MAHKSAIEWTQATWNPWHGCHKISAGCKNCYMFRDKARYGDDPNVVVRSKTKFYDPLKWSEPRTIFTCSWSDFFIEEADAWRDEAFAIMALTPQHTYQVLTKRPDRMADYMHELYSGGMYEIAEKFSSLYTGNESHAFLMDSFAAGLPNVWLGISAEDQPTFDNRLPHLLDTYAEVKWLSLEPLLGPLDISAFLNCNCGFDENGPGDHELNCPQFADRWVVTGGESGPNARPMHPDWARSIRDQCTAAGVPFFFKQWGEWAYDDDMRASYRVGKKKAGRVLDGREWNEMPEVSS